MREIAEKYIKAGFAILPIKQDKSPAVPKWKDIVFKPSDFDNAKGIGIICGLPSHGLECYDYDNHFGDAKKTLAAFIEAIKPIYDKYKFPINKTQSGGFHLLIRCEKIEGNKKLASKPKWNEKQKRHVPDAIIETRGEGGYFAAPPTKGYSFIRNSIYEVQEITESERCKLIEVAKSFNEWSEPVKTEFESKDRPGDLYNNDFTSIVNAKSLLKLAGWKELKNNQWQRPDKKDGISATFGKVAANVFYCFTANGFPFEPEKAYLPFQILALLKYNGDFKQAAKELSNDYKKENTNNTNSASGISDINKKPNNEIKELFERSYIDTSKFVKKPPVILSFRDNDFQNPDKRVFTLGNFSAITGKWKSKKTFFLSMLTGALMGQRNIQNKIIISLPIEKGHVMYFDTEQGYFDSHFLMKRIEKISEYENPDHWSGFNLREFTPFQRCDIIEYGLSKNPRVGFIVIDGIADLAMAINDEVEATRVVSLLMRWTKQYNCHIATIIHQNKLNDFATGHLGSMVMKKAEVIISTKGNETDNTISSVNCDYTRGTAPFENFDFRINEFGMPEICDFPNIVENDL